MVECQIACFSTHPQHCRSAEVQIASTISQPRRPSVKSGAGNPQIFKTLAKWRAPQPHGSVAGQRRLARAVKEQHSVATLPAEEDRASLAGRHV